MTRWRESARSMLVLLLLPWPSRPTKWDPHIHSWLNWNHVECVLFSLSCACNLWPDLENWEHWEYCVDVKYYVVCCLCQVLNLCGILCSLFAVALKSCTELDLYDAKYYVVKYYVVVLLAYLLLLVILLLPVKYKWLCMHESCCWTMNHVFLLRVVWIFFTCCQI